VANSITSMARPNVYIWIKLKRVSDIAVLCLAIFFLLSLSLHNHAFCFDNSSVKKVSQSESTYPKESNEFCPACSLYGNLKTHNVINVFDSNVFGILVAYLKPDVLIPSSFLSLQKSPRSPPVIL
jgi:hypothetical protein